MATPALHRYECRIPTTSVDATHENGGSPDKGYDADCLRDAIRDLGAEAAIPPRSNRKAPHAYDKALHRERTLAERLFDTLKQFRRVATRYDKLLPNYKGFVQLAAVVILLR